MLKLKYVNSLHKISIAIYFSAVSAQLEMIRVGFCIVQTGIRYNSSSLAVTRDQVNLTSSFAESIGASNVKKITGWRGRERGM